MTPEQRERMVDLLMVGRFDEALAIADAMLEAEPDDLPTRLYRGMALGACGQLDEALAALEDTVRRARAAAEPALVADASFHIGVIHSKREDWQAAYAGFEASAAGKAPNSDRCAAMCQALCRLGRIDEALPWRRRTIEMRDREARCDASAIVPRQRPKPFDPSARARNIVSYSLFGQDRYYHECAVTVARTNPVMFPEFTARFYCAGDLPRPVLAALRAADAQVIIVRGGGEPESPFAGLFWRFLPFDDPEVDLVLSRDVDSPILARERAAIDLWLASDAPFYGLRDDPIHAEPLLAGMWGGFTGLLPRLTPVMVEFSRRDHSRFADQRFLRQFVWPRIRTALLSIDSYNSLGTSVDYPAGFPKHGRQHVGMNWTREQILGAP